MNSTVVPDATSEQDKHDEEKGCKLKGRRNERSLKIHEKHTHRSRYMGASLPTLKTSLDKIDDKIDKSLRPDSTADKKSTKELLPLRTRPLIKEGKQELKVRKRETFLLKYALRMKQDEIEQFKAKEIEEEKKIAKLAEKLQEDAKSFDDFLKSTDELAAKAVKTAEKQTKLKMEKTDELKRLEVTFSVICADLTKKDELLTDYFNVRSSLKIKIESEPRKFQLDALASKVSYPEEWEEDCQESLSAPEKIQYLLDDPQLIVAEIHDKEDESVKLLYRMQDHQDSLEEQKQIYKQKVFKKDLELKRLICLVKIIESNIEDITRKYEEVKLNCKLLQVEEKGNVEQETKTLTQNIEKVYRCIFSRTLVRLDGLAMLSCIEKRLDQLLDEVETLPDCKVKLLQKLKDKERRLAQREEKLLLQKMKQEDRLRKALERANRINLRNVGRKLIYRSAPPAANFSSKISHETIVESESFIFFSAD